LSTREFSKFTRKLEKSDFEYLDEGSFRRVYHRKGVVIKLPINELGERHNIFEAFAYWKFRKTPTKRGALFAPCRLLNNGCLMMVYVNPYRGTADLPEWANLIDGRQVSRYRGRWVAYDFAIDIGRATELESSYWADIQDHLFCHDEYLEEMCDIKFSDVIGEEENSLYEND
jgi:hypothetical protein